MSFFNEEEDMEDNTESSAVEIVEDIPIKTDETIETSEEEKIEEQVDKEEVYETEENDEIESVSYVLSDGESLANIAEKVYPNKDNWEAIYYFNKEAIDKYLVSNGISNDFDTIKELAEDTNIFTGVKLEIPTDYNYKIK